MNCGVAASSTDCPASAIDLRGATLTPSSELSRSVANSASSDGLDHRPPEGAATTAALYRVPGVRPVMTYSG